MECEEDTLTIRNIMYGRTSGVVVDASGVGS